MDKLLKNVLSRRRFFVGLAQYASLGLLLAAAGWLVAKRYRLMREGACINGGLCNGCEIFDNCRLPLALSAKKVQQSK